MCYFPLIYLISILKWWPWLVKILDHIFFCIWLFNHCTHFSPCLFPSWSLFHNFFLFLFIYSLFLWLFVYKGLSLAFWFNFGNIVSITKLLRHLVAESSLPRLQPITIRCWHQNRVTAADVFFSSNRNRTFLIHYFLMMQSYPVLFVRWIKNNSG